MDGKKETAVFDCVEGRPLSEPGKSAEATSMKSKAGSVLSFLAPEHNQNKEGFKFERPWQECKVHTRAEQGCGVLLSSMTTVPWKGELSVRRAIVTVAQEVRGSGSSMCVMLLYSHGKRGVHREDVVVVQGC